MKPARLLVLLSFLMLFLPFLTQFAPVQLPGLIAQAQSPGNDVTCANMGPGEATDTCWQLSKCLDQYPGAEQLAERDQCYYDWKQDKCDNMKHEGYVYLKAFNHSCVTIIGFVKLLINYFLLFSSIIAGFMFLQSGYRILTSQGNPASVAEAKSQMTNAVVGIILVATSFVIINFLDSAFKTIDNGIDLIGPFTQENQQSE